MIREYAFVSYNTTEYLEYKLNELIDSGKCRYYMYIFHKHESNETKDHIHLFMDFEKTPNLSELKLFFNELDDTNRALTIVVKGDAKSKHADWIGYAMHNETYLRLKGLSKDIHYKKEDIVASDNNTFEEMYADFVELLRTSKPVIDVSAFANTYEECKRKNIDTLDLLKDFYLVADRDAILRFDRIKKEIDNRYQYYNTISLDVKIEKQKNRIEELIKEKQDLLKQNEALTRSRDSIAHAYLEKHPVNLSQYKESTECYSGEEIDALMKELERDDF